MGRKPCCVKGEVKKGPWSAEEDKKLTNFILNNGGHHCWRALPILAGLNRCGKSCRLRWTNYLRPDIKLGCFTDTEEQLVIDLHALHGNSWSKIAAMLPGRTDNEIKNRWNVNIKKKLIKKGIDPSTHKPLQENEETGSQIEALSLLGASPEIDVDQSPKSPENFKTDEAQSRENFKNDETQPPEPHGATAATDEDYQKLLMSYWVQSKFLGDDFMPPAGEEYSNEFGTSSLGNDFGREEDSGYISFNDLWTY